MKPFEEEQLLEGEVVVGLGHAPLEEVIVLLSLLLHSFVHSGLVHALARRSEDEEPPDQHAIVFPFYSPGLAQCIPALQVLRGGFDGQQKENFRFNGSVTFAGRVEKHWEAAAVLMVKFCKLKGNESKY